MGVGRGNGKRGGNGGNNSTDAKSLRGGETFQQCRKYIIQCSTFSSEWSQVRIWGRRTYSLPRASSNLVSPLRRGAPGFWNSTFFYYIFSKKGRFLSFGKENKISPLLSSLEISLWLPLETSNNGPPLVVTSFYCCLTDVDDTFAVIGIATSSFWFDKAFHRNHTNVRQGWLKT